MLWSVFTFYASRVAFFSLFFYLLSCPAHVEILHVVSALEAEQFVDNIVYHVILFAQDS